VGGRLAYIGADGNIYVTTPDRSMIIAVTDDATVAYEGAGLSYQRISWSPEGRLAYASVTRTRDQATSKLYVKETVTGPAQLIAESENHFVIYIYWSPVPCPGRPACRQLAYLIEESEGIGLHLVELEGTTLENRIIGFGWPYYFSWAGDGRSLLWHTGGSVVENEAARLTWYHLADERTEELPHQPAAFLAPAWSPQGGSWLGAIREDMGDQLQLVSENQATSLTPISPGGTSFVWSPVGERVAYAVRANDTQQYYGPIYIFDMKSGQTRQITDVGLRILAFFWDPAGERLGYLTLLSMPGEEWMQWRVYDLAQNQDRGFKAFNPSLQMRFVIASFNQYAQSHRFWSPDGRYLVYASRNEILRQEQVGLVDTWAEDGPQTIVVAGGSMGFWSWQ
jgi:TolB protein